METVEIVRTPRKKRPVKVNGIEYPSIRAAALATGTSHSYIAKCISPQARADINAKRSKWLRTDSGRRWQWKSRGMPAPPYPPTARCELCEVKFTERNSAHLDHCHKHGHFRGWLCRKCNTGLGFLQDSKELLSRASAYLTRWPNMPYEDEYIISRF